MVTLLRVWLSFYKWRWKLLKMMEKHRWKSMLRAESNHDFYHLVDWVHSKILAKMLDFFLLLLYIYILKYNLKRTSPTFVKSDPSSYNNHLIMPPIKAPHQLRVALWASCISCHPYTVSSTYLFPCEIDCICFSFSSLWKHFKTSCTSRY